MSQNSPVSAKTRQRARHFLFCVAFSEVTTRNSHQGRKDGKHHWFIHMRRSERRKLARAYAAGEWRRRRLRAA